MSNNSEIYFKRWENTQEKYCNCMHVLIILFMLHVILCVTLMLFYSKFQIPDLCRYIFSKLFWRNFKKRRKMQENNRFKTSCKDQLQSHVSKVLIRHRHWMNFVFLWIYYICTYTFDECRYVIQQINKYIWILNFAPRRNSLRERYSYTRLNFQSPHLNILNIILNNAWYSV